MERKLMILQSVLFVALGIAVASLAYALWLYFGDRTYESPYSNAKFVSAAISEIKR